MWDWLSQNLSILIAGCQISIYLHYLISLRVFTHIMIQKILQMICQNVSIIVPSWFFFYLYSSHLLVSVASTTHILLFCCASLFVYIFPFFVIIILYISKLCNSQLGIFSSSENVCAWHKLSESVEMFEIVNHYY